MAPWRVNGDGYMWRSVVLRSTRAQGPFRNQKVVEDANVKLTGTVTDIPSPAPRPRQDRQPSCS
jgi:hypothetical protein